MSAKELFEISRYGCTKEEKRKSLIFHYQRQFFKAEEAYKQMGIKLTARVYFSKEFEACCKK